MHVQCSTGMKTRCICIYSEFDAGLAERYCARSTRGIVRVEDVVSQQCIRLVHSGLELAIFARI
jgi:hypothetical protein